MCTCDHSQGVLCGTHQKDLEWLRSDEARRRMAVFAAALRAGLEG